MKAASWVWSVPRCTSRVHVYILPRRDACATTHHLLRNGIGNVLPLSGIRANAGLSRRPHSAGEMKYKHCASWPCTITEMPPAALPPA